MGRGGVAGLAARATARRQKRSRRQQLEEMKAYQAGLEEQKMQRWFDTYDKDKDGGLDRDEFAMLVRGLDKDEECDDLAVERLFEKALNGSASEKVDQAAVKDTVLRYREYLMHHEYLDNIMDKFDKDKSGALDKGEIKSMLETILKDGASLVVHSKARQYKLGVLSDAHDKGTLDDTSYTRKVNKVQGIDETKKPSIMEVTDDDVDFVMAEADTDKNGTLDREEVLASLAAWTKLLQMAGDQNDDASSMCLLM